jgi:hypothetical protein
MAFLLKPGVRAICNKAVQAPTPQSTLTLSTGSSLSKRRAARSSDFVRNGQGMSHVALLSRAVPRASMTVSPFSEEATGSNMQLQQQGEGTEHVGVVIVDHGSRKRDSNDMLVRFCGSWSICGEARFVIHLCVRLASHRICHCSESCRLSSRSCTNRPLAHGSCKLRTWK